MSKKILFVEDSVNIGKFAFNLIKEEVSPNTHWARTLSETIEFIETNPDTDLVLFHGTRVTGSEDDYALLLQNYTTNIYNNEFEQVVTPFALHVEYIKKFLPNAKTMLMSGYHTLEKKAQSLGISFLGTPVEPSKYLPIIKNLLVS